MNRADIVFLQEWIYRRTGNRLPGVAGMPVAARVEALADSLDMSTEELIEVVREGLHPRLSVQLMEAVLNGETLFFREARVFQGLQTLILPQLIAARASQRRLRIWSGACSTGQELYSLAMILRANFPAIREWQLELLGTDLSPTRIQHASRGRYSQNEVNRGLPARYLVRYFDKCDGEWVVTRELRDAIDLQVQNLIEPWQVRGLFDMILMRHVFIYFDDTIRATILRQVREKLRDDGFLVLGSGETTRPVSDLFVRTEPPLAGCYQPARAHTR